MILSEEEKQSFREREDHRTINRGTMTAGYRRLLLSLSIWLSVMASYTLPSTSSWAGGASSPQYTAAYQPDAASTHSPPPLYTPFFTSPTYAERQINNSLQSAVSVSFLLICLCPSVCLSTCCSPCSGQTRLASPLTVKGPGDEGMIGRGDRPFVGVKTHDPWVGRQRTG